MQCFVQILGLAGSRRFGKDQDCKGAITVYNFYLGILILWLSLFIFIFISIFNFLLFSSFLFSSFLFFSLLFSSFLFASLLLSPRLLSPLRFAYLLFSPLRFSYLILSYLDLSCLSDISSFFSLSLSVSICVFVFVCVCLGAWAATGYIPVTVQELIPQCARNQPFFPCHPEAFTAAVSQRSKGAKGLQSQATEAKTILNTCDPPGFAGSRSRRI